MNIERNTEATSAGFISDRADTPPAFSAVTSFSAASRENAYRTATSIAIGSVMATVKGIERRKNSPMVPQDRPRPTRSPNFLAMYCSSKRDVSADRANTNGPMCSFKTYLLIIFTKNQTLVRTRNFKHSTGLYRTPRPVYSTLHPLDSRRSRVQE